MIRAVALLSMVIDHIGLMCFEDIELFRIIGRVAFPVYLYMCVQGYKNTHSRSRYALRMLLFSVLSAYPCYLAFGNAVNIGVTYLCIIGGCFSIDLINKESMHKKGLGCLLIILIYVFSIILKGDFPYSWYGLLMGTILYLRDDKKIIITQLEMAITTFLYALLRPEAAIQLVALPVFFVLPYMKTEWIYGKIKSRYFFYLFYPMHIIILYWIKYLLIHR